ncbi:hypothetical protein BZL29_3913 [Mycobacterium kansasii]|uniref:Uncharacterized protein n=1 Tax=Mycobacterium kansasii TaxID=1768 RepID=A0A1V3XCH3_MYCKA|nr:hypothetical protein BZL29_3913 [Mycobacterium kansasii]
MATAAAHVGGIDSSFTPGLGGFGGTGGSGGFPGSNGSSGTIV